MSEKNWTGYMSLTVDPPRVWVCPIPRKVSQKERRKKERYLRSQGHAKEGK